MNNCVEWVEQVIDGQTRLICTKLYSDLSNERLTDGMRWVVANGGNLIVGLIILLILTFAINHLWKVVSHR